MDSKLDNYVSVKFLDFRNCTVTMQDNFLLGKKLKNVQDGRCSVCSLPYTQHMRKNMGGSGLKAHRDPLYFFLNNFSVSLQ